MHKLDPRLNAVRPDLADLRLQGQVEASRFAEGQVMQVAEPVISVHKAPRFDGMQLTQALLGETVRVFDEQEGWAWVQLEADGYVGHVAANALTARIASPTHRVSVPSTFLYPAPNLKTQPATPVTLNAGVAVTGEDGKFARLSDGRYVFAAHLKPIGQPEADFVAVAELFRHVPYYWGGKSVHGLDCSGLVQLSLEACGIPTPRDSDMQEAQLGTALDIDDLDGLKRGDLVFWNGHVGIMTDSQTLLHANGHHMMVVTEPLAGAAARIAQNSFGAITAIRRL